MTEIYKNWDSVAFRVDKRSLIDLVLKENPQSITESAEKCKSTRGNSTRIDNGWFQQKQTK